MLKPLTVINANRSIAHRRSRDGERNAGMPQFFKFVITTLLWLSIAGTGKVTVAETVTREGVHLRLTSDIPDARLLDDLVSSFDAAVPQWLAFWGFPPERGSGWRIDGYLMADSDAFRRSGDLPASVPNFKNGFATPTAIWVNRQSSDYYNRHLILHEGVHALAFELFGGGGPSWYMEGTAELLATHRDRPASFYLPNSDPGEGNGAANGMLAQADTQFEINELPRSRDESSMWGRYRVIEQRRNADTLPTLASVMRLPNNLEGDVDSYTWCWAASLMFTSYPDTQDAFIAAAKNGRDQSPSFTTRFFREIGDQWPALRARWQLWIHDLEYGFDRDRYRVELSTDDPRYDDVPKILAIDSRKGWQSAGVWFPAGTIRLRPSGQCVIVAKESLGNDAGRDEEATLLQRDWVSTPAGITVHFHRGAPIGQLQVCVLPVPSADLKEVNALDIRPLDSRNATAVHSASAGVTSSAEAVHTVQIDRPSWLLFRVHDVPGDDGRYQRADNRGGYQVQVSR